MTPGKPPYTVDRVSETTIFDGAGKAKRVIEVTFRVGDHGPFTEYFEKDSPWQVDAKKRLTDFANKLNAVAY